MVAMMLHVGDVSFAPARFSMIFPWYLRDFHKQLLNWLEKIASLSSENDFGTRDQNS